MNGLNISNIFGEGNEVFNQLATFHRETFKYNALRMLGSSNLIGNPAKFVNGVGTGVTDFFIKPYQGMKSGGMVKAAGGFADGSKSLLKNAFMAPVGSLSKFGQSLSKGTLAMSFDDKFIEQKNDNERINQPKNVGEGIVKGFNSAGTSIWSGVSGVFTKPIEGAKNNGVEGFFRGVGRGGAGLVTKTFSGVVDIVAKTSEGLDNQTKSQLHMMIASRRIRNPRPLYEYNYLLKEYNTFHANWYQSI
jgi:vacuolar protein sorting-associated protein 13A/C